MLAVILCLLFQTFNLLQLASERRRQLLIAPQLSYRCPRALSRSIAMAKMTHAFGSSSAWCCMSPRMYMHHARHRLQRRLQTRCCYQASTPRARAAFGCDKRFLKLRTVRIKVCRCLLPDTRQCNIVYCWGVY